MPAPVRTEQLSPDVARWLVSEAGRDARGTVARALDAGADTLAATTALRRAGLDVERAAAAMDAAEAHARLPSTLAGAGDLVFTRAALEQASDPLVAAWRAGRFADRVTADLGCGAGVDLLHVGARARRAVGIERDEARAVLASHNLRALGTVDVLVGDALRMPVRIEAVHADPSRRHGGRRARTLAEYRPSIPGLLAVAPRALGIVVSPAVSWTDPDLPADAEVEFTQRGPDLVEAVLWLGELRAGGARATATLLDPTTGETLVRSASTTHADELPTGEVGSYVVEVAPAAVRARLHDEIGAELGAWRLARGRALLTVDTSPGPSPWYRTWRVEQVLPARAKPLRAWLREAEEAPLEIATAGFDADPERWWRDLGRPPRGPQGRRLLLARLDDRSVALVLRPPKSAAPAG